MANDHERAAKWQDDLLCHVVDRLARVRPNSVFAEWVTSTSVVSVTYAQLANVVNGLAWWLVDQLGGPGDYGPSPRVLTYIGPNDVRYSALVLAAIKTGYVLFLTSPRNSPAAHRALFNHLKCQTLIAPDPVPPIAQAVLDAVNPPWQLSVPSLEELFGKQHVHYGLEKNFQDLRKSPFVIMHTSGTTGLPKPITWTHDTCSQVLNSKACEPPDGAPTVDETLLNGKRVIVTLPPFHGALLAHLMLGAIPFGNIVIAPVSSGIPTARAVVDAMNQTAVDSAVLVPSIVSELAQSSDLLDYCSSHLQSIIYIGGDLPQYVGDHVASKIYLRCQWGATETGIVPQLLPTELYPPTPQSRDMWRYVQFHPCVGAIFDEATDGVYELVMRRNKTFNMANLPTNGLEDRVSFIRAELEKPLLGLEPEAYQSLDKQVGIIIHAAWPVNFNLTLNDFRPQLAGLVNLLALAATSGVARFIFISSVAAVERYIAGPAPEEVLHGFNIPAPFGYARAKFLAELLVDIGAQHLKSFVPMTIIRVGQVAGAVKRAGLWNPAEWLPSMVLSSLHLGQLPQSLGPRFSNVDFVPIDSLATILADLSTVHDIHEESGTFKPTVFNIRNPLSTAWRTLLPAIIENGNTTIEIVPPTTWIASLRASNYAEEELGRAVVRNPALKLLEFYEGLWSTNLSEANTQTEPMKIEHSIAASQALKELEQVNLQWMRKWVDEWIAWAER